MDKKRLTKYLMITFLITWVCWWGDALLVKVTSLTESNVFPMVIFTMGGFGPTIAACFCMEGGFTKKNLRRFLFNNTKKNWLTILAAVIVETIVFFICSEGSYLYRLRSCTVEMKNLAGEVLCCRFWRRKFLHL